MNNADDEIRLRLSLDEASIGTVESRIRQIVNQLGNQRLNITANLNGVNTAIKSLEKLQERVRELQNSTINISANPNALTPAQQQYRLETQRLQVAQRLSIEREKTAQSENRAVQALAQENRTLTRNYNINQQINGTIDHQHRRMQDLNNQAGNFTRTLTRGLTAYIGYKAVNAIYSSISNAYQELKAVDTELVNVRKVTDLSAEAMERLEKSSYKVAQNYGRAASEYLTATAAFAKAGYNDKSAELGELSLLTENVGDVDNKLATQFLISADAAWKYQGNIQKLTTIVDGFNEISNRTATSVEDLAKGITVAGSVFSQAGLSAQEYAAMVGTAQAKTQRSGDEIARGLRTTLLSIRQIKGTDIETGEVIDEEKLAKAEASLKAIGINIRETVNGIDELRSPMVILQELADKWENLSSVQKSAITEALAQKRQSNVLTALLENWQDVEKAMDIYADSAGSAMRENQYYLDSWNAKLEILKATWTSFIADLTDVSIIKSGLDAVSAVIKVLDTDVGRFVVQIGLLVAVMNLLNRGFAWVQGLKIFQKLNLSAEILRITAAELGLGAATRTLATTLWEAAAAWAATPMGMATIAIGSIIAISSAVDAYNRKQEENRQKIKSAADEAASATKELTDLTNSYFELSAAVQEDASQKDNLITTQD